jgi:hypothetical protein
MVQSQNLQKKAKIANSQKTGPPRVFVIWGFAKKRVFSSFPKKGTDPKIGKNAKKSESGSKKTYSAYMVMTWILCTPFFSARYGKKTPKRPFFWRTYRGVPHRVLGAFTTGFKGKMWPGARRNSDRKQGAKNAEKGLVLTDGTGAGLSRAFFRPLFLLPHWEAPPPEYAGKRGIVLERGVITAFKQASNYWLFGFQGGGGTPLKNGFPGPPRSGFWPFFFTSWPKKRSAHPFFSFFWGLTPFSEQNFKKVRIK